MSELDQLTKLCESLGAPTPQARTMALQLLKRAEQLAIERAIPRQDAMAHLLNLVVKGRAGEVPPEMLSSPRASEPPADRDAF
jgi:hypothetical protein